ncbi:hypothetical protein L204_104585 [Cryptococcus depauperatus]
MATQEEPKRKRRQNVACDCCKLRRVKCDLASLLLSLNATNSVASTPEIRDDEISLAQLAKEHPNVGCTNCNNKYLKCTTNQIQNPTRPKKGGRRIDEARRRFGANGGDDETNSASPKSDNLRPESNTRTSYGDAQDSVRQSRNLDYMPLANTQHQRQAPAEIRGDMDSQLAILLTGNVSHPSIDPGSTSVQTSSVVPLLCERQDSTIHNVTYDPPTDHVPSMSPRLPETHMLQDVNSFETLDPMIARYTTNLEAASIWQQFTTHPKESLAYVQRTGMTPKAATVIPMELTDENSLLGDIRRSYNLVVDPVTSLSGSTPSTAFETHTSIGRPVSVQTSLQIAPNTCFTTFSLDTSHRKRNQPDSRSPSPGPGKVTIIQDDPWRLWEEERDARIGKWGRKEAIQENLADRALGYALSRHLVKTFFQAVHSSFPVISPESFYLDWIRADQRSDRMTPAQEVLCSAIEAWGARYSDSHVVLGIMANKVKTAPQVIQPNGTFEAGGRARVHWGRARLSVCNALVERTRRLIDVNGLLRKPSITGIQALTLFQQLLQMTDEEVDAQSHFMEGHLIHSTIIEQMGILGLMWNSKEPIVTGNQESSMSLIQLRMKQRRLFWAHAVNDSFWAASSGNEPKIPQDEIDSAGEWLNTVQEHLPISSFKVLTFFLSCYHKFTNIARQIANKLTVKGRKQGTIDVPQFCSDTRKFWGEIDSVIESMVMNLSGILNNCTREDLLAVGFSPLDYLANLRLSCSVLLLLIHQVLREQLTFRQSLSSACIIASEDSPASTLSGNLPIEDSFWSATQSYVEMLETLKRDSIDMLLKTCRAQTEMFKTILPTGIIQTATILQRNLISTAQLLAEIPTNEQGYPDDTPGGYDWTWEVKQREVNCCTDALYQMGWAWADVTTALDKLMITMKQMTPTPEELETYKSRRKYNSKAASRKEQELKANEEVLSAAMRHWPPANIPEMIGNILKVDSTLDGGSHGRPLIFHHTRSSDEFQEQQFDPMSVPPHFGRTGFNSTSQVAYSNQSNNRFSALESGQIVGEIPVTADIPRQVSSIEVSHPVGLPSSVFAQNDIFVQPNFGFSYNGASTQQTPINFESAIPPTPWTNETQVPDLLQSWFIPNTSPNEYMPMNHANWESTIRWPLMEIASGADLIHPDIARASDMGTNGERIVGGMEEMMTDQDTSVTPEELNDFINQWDMSNLGMG